MSSGMTQLGTIEALSAFGLEKHAFNWRGMGQYMKQTMVGEPGKFMGQFRDGKLLAPEGMLRQAFQPRPLTVDGKLSLGGVVNNMLMYGLPAYGVYQAARAPEGQRGSTIGMTLGGVIGGLAGTPLGMLGQGVGTNLGASLGRSLGGAFDQRAPRSSDTYR